MKDSTMPEHLRAAVAALKSAGWVEPLEAVQMTGRGLDELLRLIESGELKLLELGPWWWVEGVPFGVNLLRLAELEAAPRRPALRAVEPCGR